MRVFKPTYRDRKGRVRQGAKWYIELRDQNETVRRLPAFTSRAASEECGRKLAQLVAYYRSGGGQTGPALMVWLETLPNTMRRKLAAVAQHLADLREDKAGPDGPAKPGIAAQTSSFILAARQQFCRWMVKHHRAHQNPLTHLDKLNARADRRHDRRVKARAMESLANTRKTRENAGDTKRPVGCPSGRRRRS